MTKVGQGGQAPHEPDKKDYEKQLAQNVHKFKNALEQYQTSEGKQRAHLKDVMDQSLGLIRSAVSEIKRSGLEKHEKKMEKDYHQYIAKEDPQAYSNLQEDIDAMQEF